jgi:hypothetical protein
MTEDMYSRLQALYQYLLHAVGEGEVQPSNSDVMCDVYHNNSAPHTTNQPTNPMSVSKRVIFKCDRLL